MLGKITKEYIDMTRQMIHTIEQMHELFHHFLTEKFEGDVVKVQDFISTAEEVLFITLNKYFDTSLTSIYNLQDDEEIVSLCKKIKVHPILKNIDKQEEPRYTEVLKWYGLFVKSLKKETTPILVPGEEYPFPSNVSAPLSPPIEHNDADYAPDTEGLEHQYNLTKKERNPELRRKCVEYYKNLWGGRIHCICCGFDFGKAYGDIGEDYIEIHHVNPHHTYQGVHLVDPTKDLIPLCSNCHSMIHKVKGQGDCMTLKELNDHYKGVKYND